MTTSMKKFLVNTAQMWNIMDKYGYIQDYPKVKK